MTVVVVALVAVVAVVVAVAIVAVVAVVTAVAFARTDSLPKMQLESMLLEAVVVVVMIGGSDMGVHRATHH